MMMTLMMIRFRKRTSTEVASIFAQQFFHSFHCDGVCVMFPVFFILLGVVRFFWCFRFGDLFSFLRLMLFEQFFADAQCIFSRSLASRSPCFQTPSGEQQWLHCRQERVCHFLANYQGISASLCSFGRSSFKDVLRNCPILTTPTL